jgi:hypothetical protein
MTSLTSRGEYAHFRTDMADATNIIKIGGLHVDVLVKNIAGLPRSEMENGVVRTWKNGVKRFEDLRMLRRQRHDFQAAMAEVLAWDRMNAVPPWSGTAEGVKALQHKMKTALKCVLNQ